MVPGSVCAFGVSLRLIERKGGRGIRRSGPAPVRSRGGHGRTFVAQSRGSDGTSDGAIAIPQPNERSITGRPFLVPNRRVADARLAVRSARRGIPIHARPVLFRRERPLCPALHPPGGRVGAGLDAGRGVHESPLWPRNRAVDAQSSRIRTGRCDSRLPGAGPDRYGLVAHVCGSRRNPVPPRPPKVRGRRTGSSVPERDRGVPAWLLDRPTRDPGQPSTPAHQAREQPLVCDALCFLRRSTRQMIVLCPAATPVSGTCLYRDPD